MILNFFENNYSRQAGFDTYVWPHFIDGCEAVVIKKHFTFNLSDRCNYCDLQSFFELLGPNTKIVSASDNNGVNVFADETRYLWFAEVPTHCTCNLPGENYDNRKNP